MRTLKTLSLAAALLSGTMALADGHLPLKTLPDDADRDFWVPEQVNADGALDAMQAVVGAEAVPFKGSLENPLQIALIYPSADVSDFWARNYLALVARLDELGIAYETREFASRQIEHSLQATYAAQVDQDADIYDFVIFGPSELATQADNIDKLSANPDLTTFVWAFHTPLKYLENQPANWFDFSSAFGALKMCDYMLERLGNDVTYAMN
ncbi:MAG: ribose ABC transporter substrate-binding protein, partial [Pseudomonadota bacterium]